MAVRDILLLGNPKFHIACDPVDRSERDDIGDVVTDLHDTLIDFRERHGAGRTIGAPQIDVMKRLVYMHIDKPTVFINPLKARGSTFTRARFTGLKARGT